ncbi:hypothetical protein [uncultured Luteimonas sp.]|uniref:hypothetical protein n=1 Tax=uncultured Luteimonas sp. TaxID=453144 RepID=UPI0026333E6B|nr:hypothetical protein [uncultured Luteimonas sp.]
MTKFNKGVLASAIAATVMLAGTASAARLGYDTPVQITYAKDLFATDSRTIDLPADFTVYAQSASEVDAAEDIVAGHSVEVVISLGQGANAAKFQSAWVDMQPANLATAIIVGEEGGAAAGGQTVAALGGTVTYSAGERELRIVYTASTNGDVDASANTFALRLPSLRLYDLQGALLTGSVVNGGISITNQDVPQTVLAGNAVFARSVWGEEVSFRNNNPATLANKWIDAQRCAADDDARILFSMPGAAAAGTVGTSCGYVDNDWFRAGTINVAIAQADEVGLPGTGPESPVNNFDGATPTEWSLAASRITYTIEGTNLSAFDGNNAWLDIDPTCSKATDSFINLTVNAAGTQATGSHTMDSPANATLSGHFLPLTTAAASGVDMHVCLAATGDDELIPQVLSGSVSIDHRVPALFVNPPDQDGSLYPLRANTGLFIFQNVNPGSNPTAQSFLRLTNNNAVSCSVTIDAKDDLGLLSGQVQYTIAPHASEQFNIDVLESGVDNRGRAMTGALGDGTGKWYVRVQPECADFTASALNRNAVSGTVTDLTHAKNEVWLTPDDLLNP